MATPKWVGHRMDGMTEYTRGHWVTQTARFRSYEEICPLLHVHTLQRDNIKTMDYYTENLIYLNYIWEHPFIGVVFKTVIYWCSILDHSFIDVAFGTIQFLMWHLGPFISWCGIWDHSFRDLAFGTSIYWGGVWNIHFVMWHLGPFISWCGIWDHSFIDVPYGTIHLLMLYLGPFISTCGIWDHSFLCVHNDTFPSNRSYLSFSI